MTNKELIWKQAWLVCCPMCDNDKCMRGSEKCEAVQWAKQKLKEVDEDDTQ